MNRPGQCSRSIASHQSSTLGLDFQGPSQPIGTDMCSHQGIRPAYSLMTHGLDDMHSNTYQYQFHYDVQFHCDCIPEKHADNLATKDWAIQTSIASTKVGSTLSDTSSADFNWDNNFYLSKCGWRTHNVDTLFQNHDTQSIVLLEKFGFIERSDYSGEGAYKPLSSS